MHLHYKFASYSWIDTDPLSPVDGVVAEVLEIGETKECGVGPHEEMDVIGFIYSELT